LKLLFKYEPYQCVFALAVTCIIGHMQAEASQLAIKHK